MRRLIVTLFGAAILAGCSTFVPDKPVRPTLYDFGPGDLAEAPAPTGVPLVLSDVDVSGTLESSALLYRLAYADANQLRPYAYARWSAPPGLLVQQRLRQVLGRSRPVVDAANAGALARRSGTVHQVLRVELEEFSHLFQSEATSLGVVRMRCTLLEVTAGGERLVAQRTFTTQRPAPTADAAGGVRALSASMDATAEAVSAWVQQAR